MSRLIVKNLPKHITQERLRKHFSQKGEVTDVKLVKTKDGVFRRFGYVGFKTQAQADAARKYFDRSFIDTSRIEVEIAKPIGDDSLPRAWSRYTEGSSAHARTTEQQKQKEQQRLQKTTAAVTTDARGTKHDKSNLETLLESGLNEKQKRFIQDLQADKNDPALKEFLEVMRPRAAAKGHTWANDDVLAARDGDVADVLKQPVMVAGDADDDLYDELPAMKSDNTTTGKESSDDNKSQEHDKDPNENETQDAPEHKGVAFDKTLSDLDYIRSKMQKQEQLNIHPSRLAALESSGAVDANQTTSVQTMRRWEGRRSDQNQTENSVVDGAISEADDETEAVVVHDQCNTKHGDDNTKDEANDIDDDEENVDSNAVAEYSEPIENKPPPAELIADTGRLMICNLAFSCTPEDIEKLLKPYGRLTEVHIPIDRDTKQSRGYAFAQFMLPENALKAYLALEHRIFQGRILEILPAKERPVSSDEAPLPPGAKQTFKVKRERERQSNASSDFNWNSLFMNQDTVAEAMAHKLGVKKSDILDPDADNMAVRLAIAETSIISETKTHLEEEGVVLDAFTRRKDRSNTIILVKNISFSTEEDELVEMFGKFGTLGRVVLPPTRTMALVEFVERNEAKSAFRRLAYSKFKSLPLFLEWAPVGTFAQAHDPVKEAQRREARRTVNVKQIDAVPAAEDVADAAMNGADANDNVDEEEPASKGRSTSKANNASNTVSSTLDPAQRAAALRDLAKTTQGGGDEEDTDDMPVATVFVKNLNFITSDEGLRMAFAGLPGLRSARVARKPDAKTGGKLSMGFGFLEFIDKECAMRCIKTMQGFKLDGHEVVLKFSNAATKARTNQRGAKRTSTNQGNADDDDDDDDDEEGGDKAKSTKLVIRNVPFEATKKDIRQLFNSFGQVKSVRLPRKFDGTHRGFAFVDFLTKQEAKAAKVMLAATHLYGRHLVTEWALDDESVEAMRGKTAKSFVADSTKRRKVEMEDDMDDDDRD